MDTLGKSVWFEKAKTIKRMMAVRVYTETRPPTMKVVLFSDVLEAELDERYSSDSPLPDFT